MTAGAPQRTWPLPARSAVIGATIAGVVGAVVGLIVGLYAYAPTAWFALFELGLPSALVGAALGAAVGAILTLRRRAVRSRSD